MQVIDDCGLPDLDASPRSASCIASASSMTCASRRRRGDAERRHGRLAVGRGRAVPIAAARGTRSVRRRAGVGRRRSRAPRPRRSSRWATARAMRWTTTCGCGSPIGCRRKGDAPTPMRARPHPHRAARRPRDDGARRAAARGAHRLRAGRKRRAPEHPAGHGRGERRSVGRPPRVDPARGDDRDDVPVEDRSPGATCCRWRAAGEPAAPLLARDAPPLDGPAASSGEIHVPAARARRARSSCGSAVRHGSRQLGARPRVHCAKTRAQVRTCARRRRRRPAARALSTSRRPSAAQTAPRRRRRRPAVREARRRKVTVDDGRDAAMSVADADDELSIPSRGGRVLASSAAVALIAVAVVASGGAGRAAPTTRRAGGAGDAAAAPGATAQPTIVPLASAPAGKPSGAPRRRRRRWTRGAAGRSRWRRRGARGAGRTQRRSAHGARARGRGAAAAVACRLAFQQRRMRDAEATCTAARDANPESADAYMGCWPTRCSTATTGARR